jgi:hypothetical protein
MAQGAVKTSMGNMSTMSKICCFAGPMAKFRSVALGGILRLSAPPVNTAGRVKSADGFQQGEAAIRGNFGLTMKPTRLESDSQSCLHPW